MGPYGLTSLRTRILTESSDQTRIVRDVSIYAPSLLTVCEGLMVTPASFSVKELMRLLLGAKSNHIVSVMSELSSSRLDDIHETTNSSLCRLTRDETGHRFGCRPHTGD